MTIGRSAEGRPIEAITFRAGDDPVLVLAGVHGDEPKGVYVAERLIELLEAQPQLCKRARATIVPRLNPDGCLRRRRRNANRVDLNRNMPSRDWGLGRRRSRYYGGPSAASEPETRTLIRLIQKLHPRRIVSIHSIDRHRFCNNWNGPAERLARRMSAANGYPITDDIGYPTPGSFGTWAGLERGIPTITLEVPSHHSRERCWRDNRSALLAFIRGRE